jgi:hypothetical protein
MTQMPPSPDPFVENAVRPDRGRLLGDCLGLAAVYLLVLLATRSPDFGDTALYAGTVAKHFGGSPFEPTDSLWEFGHLLWRPLGWLLLTLSSPLLTKLTDWTVFMQAAFGMICISWAASVATVVLWYLLLTDFVRSRTVAIFITLALACAHGFLLYTHSGSSYDPGVACLTASLYCIRRDRLNLAAVFYALGTLVWLPYILGGPALFLLAAYPGRWDLPVRESLASIRLPRAMRFALLSTVIILIVYSLGGAARGVRSVSEAKAWFTDANHGWSQSQRGLRLATGLPRSTFYLGRDGMLFKRFLRHDPYAPAGVADLVKASLWKMGVFYVILALLLYELLRASRSGWPMLVFLAGVVPIVFFAVFIFEPSSPPRFLPAFPFVLLAVGWIFREVPARPRFSAMNLSQAALAACMLVATASNLFAFAAPRILSEDAASWNRIAQLRARIIPNSAIVTTTNQDRMQEYLSRSIFGAVNRPQSFLLYDVMEPGTVRMLQWRGEFAAYVFGTWKNGGEVWVSRRVWSEKPKPDWNWVERDDPLQVWQDLYTYFRPIQTDADCDGSDGFSRVAHTSANIDYLTPFAAAYKPPAYVATAPGSSHR